MAIVNDFTGYCCYCCYSKCLWFLAFSHLVTDQYRRFYINTGLLFKGFTKWTYDDTCNNINPPDEKLMFSKLN